MNLESVALGGLNFLALLIAFCLTLLIAYRMRAYASALSLQDIPAGRKQHKVPTPVVGGIGVVVAFVFVVFSFHYGSFFHASFWVASLFLFIVGVLDDMREFSSKIKFIAQAVAALMMIYWGHVRLFDLGNLFGTGDVLLAGWGVVLTIVGVMGVVNAFNMIDGIDGLCGTQSIVPILAFAGIFLIEGKPGNAIVLLILVAAIFGFLALNLRLPGRSQALVFLGDAGSLFLGFVIAWVSIQISETNERVIKPVAVLWFLTIPLFDTVAVMLRRMLRKHSPFKADRTHIHHVLQDLGLDVSLIVRLLFILSVLFATFGLIGILLLQIPDSILFFSFLLFFILYYFAKNLLFVLLQRRLLKSV